MVQLCTLRNHQCNPVEVAAAVFLKICYFSYNDQGPQIIMTPSHITFTINIITPTQYT